GAAADAVDVADPRADGGAEHHEIERSRHHGRDDALADGAPGAAHLELEDGADGPEIHGALTKLTKMSSSDDCVVSRSAKRMPALRRSPSREVMPVRSLLVS